MGLSRGEAVKQAGRNLQLFAACHCNSRQTGAPEQRSFPWGVMVREYKQGQCDSLQQQTWPKAPPPSSQSLPFGRCTIWMSRASICQSLHGTSGKGVFVLSVICDIVSLTYVIPAQRTGSILSPLRCQ